jgi:glycerophosphoryl diester phosphodiesterase
MNRWFPPEKPLVLAHRGASAYAPENTLAAFRLAVAQGADGVELDARLSVDGQVVVFHDQTTLRLTGVPGRVRDKTLDQLRALDAGAHFSPAFAGERIPTLDEVLAEMGGKVLVDIELSNYGDFWNGLAGQVAAIVQRHNAERWVLFTSFWPANLLAIQRLLPRAPVGLLALPGLPGRVAVSRFLRRVSPELLVTHHRLLDETTVRAERLRERQVFAYTVNDPGLARRLLAAGVNGIITDDPPAIRAVVEEGEGDP